MASGSLHKILAIVAVAVLLTVGAICFVPLPGRWFGRNDGQSIVQLLEAEGPSNGTVPNKTLATPSELPQMLNFSDSANSTTPPPASPDEGVSRWAELQARLDKMTAMSQNSDIQRRGQWQKLQIDNYCQKYGKETFRNTMPTVNNIRQNLYRHMIFDDEKKVLFCFIPKVGCTNMRKFFFLSQGLIPETVLSVDNADSKQHAELELSYLEPAINKATFAKVNMTDRQRIWRVRSYYKFTFVRNPLERLLSAYLDKIAPQLRYTRNVMNDKTYPERLREQIVAKFRNAEYKKWTLSKGSIELCVTFMEYIKWIINSNLAEINEHFAPLIANAQPCRMRYHFYGNFKLYDSEMGHLIKKLDANPKYFESVSYHESGNKTEDLVQQYYSQLPEDLRQQLFHKFYQELDFYYHLYPEDSLSHVHTLGVQEEIPVHCSDCNSSSSSSSH